MWRATGHFTAGANDVSWTRLLVALRQCGFDRGRCPVAQRPHRVEVTQQHLGLAHRAARMAEWRQKIEVDDIGTSLAHAFDDALGVATNVQPNRNAESTDGRYEPLFIRQH